MERASGINNKPIGLDLKVSRLRAGIKQYQLAAQLGITPIHLSEIENGRREASPELIAKIEAAIHAGQHRNEG